MLIWTVQTKSVWKKIRHEGIFLTDKSLIRHKEFFLPHYKWMADQMIKRLGLSAYISDCLPVWGWYQYDGEKMRKPDLRRSGHLPKDTYGVRPELEKDPAGVLLSDFELWHYVLSYWYLPKSKSL